MEASLDEVQHISQPSCSPIELTSIDLAVAHDKQEAEKCEHFTIRGYVTEVRKKDPKICWPFSTLSNYSPTEDAMLLPPLSVRKFRRWDCKTCWGTIISSASAVENGGVMNTSDDELKNGNCLLLHNNTAASCHDPTKLSSSLVHPCEENALKGRSNNANSSIAVTNSENLSSPCCDKKRNEYGKKDIPAELTKEGLKIPINEHTIIDRKQKELDDSACTAVEHDKCLKISSNEHHISTGEQKEELLYDSVCSAVKDDKYLHISENEHIISDGDLKEPRVSVDTAVENDNYGSEERGEKITVVTVKEYESSLGEHDLDMVSAKESGVKSVPGITTAEMYAHLTSEITNVNIFYSEADMRRKGITKEPSDTLSGRSRRDIEAHISDRCHIGLEDNNKMVKRKRKMKEPSDILSGGSRMHVEAHMFDHDSIGLENNHERLRRKGKMKEPSDNLSRGRLHVEAHMFDQDSIGSEDNKERARRKGKMKEPSDFLSGGSRMHVAGRTSDYESIGLEDNNDRVRRKGKMKEPSDILSGGSRIHASAHMSDRDFIGLEDNNERVSRKGKMKEPSDILSGRSRKHVATHMSDHDYIGLEDNNERVKRKGKMKEPSDIHSGGFRMCVAAHTYDHDSISLEETNAMVRRKGKMKEQSDILSGGSRMHVASLIYDHDSINLEENTAMARRKGKMMERSDVFSGGSRMHVAAHISDHDSIGLENNSGASETDITIFTKMTRNHNNVTKLEKEPRKMKRVKVRKVRLLNDIMRDDEPCMPGKTHILEGDTDNKENTAEKMEGTSKGEIRNPEHKKRFIGRKSEGNHSVKEKKSDVIQNGDGKQFLLKWLKKMPTKRVVFPQGDVDTETDDFSSEVSKHETDISVSDPNIVVQNIRLRKGEAVEGTKESRWPRLKARWTCNSLQQENNTGKVYTAEYLPNDHIQQKTAPSSKDVKISEKILNHGVKVRDSTHQKDISSRKRRKSHQADSEQSCQLQLPKVKVTKKRRTIRTWDKEVVDDIPMDIVELLANNLQEKRLMNVAQATKSMDDFSPVTDNPEDGGTTWVAKCSEKQIQQNPHTDSIKHGVWATETSQESAYHRLRAYHNSPTRNQGEDIYTNQQAMIDPSTRFHAFSRGNVFPMSGERLPFTGQYDNSSIQNFCRDRMQASGYRFTPDIIPDRNSGRRPNDASGASLNEGTYGINGQKIDPNFNPVNMDPSNSFLQRDRYTSVHGPGWHRSSFPPVSQPLVHQWRNESIGQGPPAATTSFLEVGNGCHSTETKPADQQIGENVFPSNNFPQMWSGGYFPGTSNMYHPGLVQASEHCSTNDSTALLGSCLGARGTETVQTQGNSSMLVRPVPRFGVLGSHLQKEIMNRSGNFRPPTCFRDYSQTVPLKKASCSATESSIPRVHPISRAEYSRWATPNTDTTSHPKSFQTNNGMGHTEFRNRDASVQPQSSSFSVGICTVNRNPADFTLPEQKNIYMRGKESLTPELRRAAKRNRRQANREKAKQQKTKKLSSLQQMAKD